MNESLVDLSIQGQVSIQGQNKFTDIINCPTPTVHSSPVPVGWTETNKWFKVTSQGKGTIYNTTTSGSCTCEIHIIYRRQY